MFRYYFKGFNKISNGEVKQLVSIKNLHTNESEYLDIINHKTAELFSAACQIGGEVSEINSEKENVLLNLELFLEWHIKL